LSLNRLLPPDIRGMKIEPVDPDFHARYSALSKTYHYYLHLDKISDPFTIKTRYQVFKRLHFDLLEQAAQKFIGIHDFTSFTNEPQRGSVARDPIRHLKRLDVFPIEKGVRLEFEANGFLYKMVRNITAALIECACGKVPPSRIKEIFDAKDRRKAFFTAPPQGLFLMHVQYQETTPHAELLELAQR
ncbi:MAG: tRNA pseudouridine synthase A, partial [Chlamydiales bacterium]|nr:tRNA pseudouridine synthase A [Chlamydiales bacterium]